MNEQWKKKAIENQNAAREIIRSAEEKLAGSLDNMINVLELGASFYQYSVNNMMLIYMQREDATYIQSFEAWKKMGASVLQGEKGIKIFVPVQTTMLMLRNGETCPLSEATPEQKELYDKGVIEGKTKITYKIGNVFDISQTNFPVERRNELFAEEKPEEMRKYIDAYYSLVKNIVHEKTIPQEKFRDACTAVVLLKCAGFNIEDEFKNIFDGCYSVYCKELKNTYPELAENEVMKKVEETMSQAMKQFREIRNNVLKNLESESVVPAVTENVVDEKEVERVLASVVDNVSKTAQDNYKAMMALVPEIMKGEKEYVKYLAGPGFMPLSIKCIGKNMIAVAHYYEQNGDLMADPDMTFEIDHEKQTLNARSFQQDGFLGRYDCVIREDGSVNERMEKELNSFAKTWLKNIKQQGYKPVIPEEAVKFYTSNLDGTGQNTESVFYEDAKAALNAYLTAELVDGKRFGVQINGRCLPFAQFNMVEYRNVLSRNISNILKDGYDDSDINPDEIGNYIRKELIRDNICIAIEKEFSNLAEDAAASMIRQKSEWGAWFGRIVNHVKPENYLEIDITGLSTHHKIQYEISLVEGNKIVDGRGFFLPTNQYDFENSIRKGTEEASSVRFNPFLRSVIDKLINLDEWTLEFENGKAYFDAYIGKDQEQHYRLLRQAGYEEFPKKEIQEPIQQEKSTIYSYEVVGNYNYPSEGERYDNITTPADAIAQFLEMAGRNTMPGINLKIVSDNNTEPITLPLSVGRNIDLSVYKNYPVLKEDAVAVEHIKDFVREARKNDFQTYGRFDIGMEQNRRRCVR